MSTQINSKEAFNAAVEAKEKEIRTLTAEFYRTQGPTTDKAAQIAARKLARAEKYKTKNGLTVHELRKAGNRVRVCHVRYIEVPGVAVAIPVPLYMKEMVPPNANGGPNFAPNGGATHIHITSPLGHEIGVSSVCHIDDSFDYKLGVKYALDQINQTQANNLLAVGAVEVLPDLVV